jgi:hypothetical protein
MHRDIMLGLRLTVTVVVSMSNTKCAADIVVLVVPAFAKVYKLLSIDDHSIFGL